MHDQSVSLQGLLGAMLAVTCSHDHILARSPTLVHLPPTPRSPTEERLGDCTIYFIWLVFSWFVFQAPDLVAVTLLVLRPCVQNVCSYSPGDMSVQTKEASEVEHELL